MPKQSGPWQFTKDVETKMIRRYSELIELKTLEERYDYLKIGGNVGERTFGWDRHFNQTFYKSAEWTRVRREVIVRDLGCDLGVPGYEIGGRILIHHMNPMGINDLRIGNPDILNPEFLICTSNQTHQAIHYGDAALLPQIPIVRSPGDTKLW